MRKRFAIIFLVFIYSFQESNYRILDFGQFKITVPKNWNKFNEKGLDSYIGGIITDTKDTLKFDLGRHSQDLIKSDFPMVYDARRLAELTVKELEMLPDTKHLIVDSTTRDINYHEYLQYQFENDSISCFKAKFITPRNKKFGGSGIYIDSLKGSDKMHYKISFNFYGWYLDEKTQDKFFKALKTLQFKEDCENN
ncbi:hypothetical protein [Christiangramia sp. OXR-203]|jgi:hypothetical protein|uniref:hypothetical protein n=1 Tax=Christiangramia sp. OXR-203 TaxID=3100176 RepID=UPI002AC98C3C|nr:hypothetical protein [Christiangramia sp. OXR-203]WPY97661.1 hypothetical protein T8I65_10790 [Christiangramia sp. OXR-203]